MRLARFAAIMLLTVGAGLFTCAPVLGQSIIVDHVDGVEPGGSVPDGATLTFHIRLTGDANAHTVISNGFRFHSDRVTWGSVEAQMNPAYPWDLSFGFPCFFDLGMFINYFNCDGQGADTIGFGGAAGLYGSGLPAGFDDIGWTITIGPVYGDLGGSLVLDSAWYPPAGYWLWDIVEENVAWGGPYEFWFGCPICGPWTYCTPQPTVLKNIERILDVHIVDEDVDAVDLESIRVQSKIPPYTGVRIENGEIITDVFIMRFLGASGFRPVTGDFEATYTVEYDHAYNGHVVLTGDFALIMQPGDVTLDGITDTEDIIFMVDYLWMDGPVTAMDEYKIEELMDIDQNGRVDIRDLRGLVDLVY